MEGDDYDGDSPTEKILTNIKQREKKKEGERERERETQAPISQGESVMPTNICTHVNNLRAYPVMPGANRSRKHEEDQSSRHSQSLTTPAYHGWVVLIRKWTEIKANI